MTEGTQEQVQNEGKRCTSCKEVKPRSEFSRNRLHKDGLGSYCSPCQGTKLREQRRRDPDEYRRKVRETRRIQRAELTEDERRWIKIWGRYKLSKERYESLLAEQGGGCAGCGRNIPLHIDHDHSCCPGSRSCGSCVRGLLCKGCNVAIGFAEENAEALLRLATYLMVERVPVSVEPRPRTVRKFHTKTCWFCFVPYSAARRDAKYCSRRCAKAGFRARVQEQYDNRDDCSVDGCDRKIVSRKMCRSHYDKARGYVDPRRKHAKLKIVAEPLF